MKRFISFLIFATAIACAGCSNSSVNEPTHTQSAVSIKGHTYKTSDGTNYVSFYFASNFSCSMTANVNGEYTANPHMTYKIDGNNVDIFRDNSTYWESSARNTLLYHMYYRPYEDTLVMDNLIFKREN